MADDQKLKKTPDEFTNELDSFFSSGDDIDMKKLDRKKRSGAFVPILIIGILIAAASFFSYLGYRFFSEKISHEESPGFTLSFTGAQNYPLTTPTELILDMVNNDTESEEVSVLLEYPQEVIIIESSPQSENSQHTLWKFLNVKRGEKLRIVFTLRIEDSSFEEKTIRATALYRQKGISSAFSVSTSTTIKTSQPLELFSLEGPQKIQPSQPLNYTLRLRDISGINTDQTFVSVHLPPSFIITSVLPKGDSGDFSWSKELLQKNQNLFTKEVVIIINGSYKEGTHGIQDIRAVLTQGEKLQQKILQENAFATNVSTQTLTLNMQRDPSDSKVSYSYGDAIKFIVHYENESDEVFSNMELILEAQGPVDWNKSMAHPAALLKDSSFIWTEKEFNRLSLIQPQTHGDFLVTLVLLSPQAVRAQMTNPEKPFELSENFEVKARARVHRGQAQDAKDNVLEVSSEIMKLPLNSDLSLTSRVDQIEEGTVRVTLHIQNSLHEIEALELQGILTQHIEWKDSFRVSAGTLTYHEQTRKLEWLLNRLPRSVGSLEIWFDLDVSQYQAKELVTKLFLQAKDTTTGGILQHEYAIPY